MNVEAPTEFEQAIALAQQVGRSEALMDAEKAVLEVRKKTKTREDAHWLTLAAAQIQKLRA